MVMKERAAPRRLEAPRPPHGELVDAVTRWGIDGAAEEYDVAPRLVCQWLSEEVELKETTYSGIDAPVSFGANDRVTNAPTWRQVWRWKHHLDQGGHVRHLEKTDRIDSRNIQRWVARLNNYLEAQEEARRAAAAPTEADGWMPLATLAREPGAPAHNTIHSRAQSDDPNWANYEIKPVYRAASNPWRKDTSFVYRLTPGTTFDGVGKAYTKADGWMGCTALKRATGVSSRAMVRHYCNSTDPTWSHWQAMNTRGKHGPWPTRCQIVYRAKINPGEGYGPMRRGRWSPELSAWIDGDKIWTKLGGVGCPPEPRWMDLGEYLALKKEGEQQ